jgi:ribosome-associated heat shock protein Hsp15
VSESALQIRLDKWLWYARQTKSRSLAQKLVTGGNVRINANKVASPSKMVGPGDVLTLTMPAAVRVLRIVECGKRRGPYAEAQTLYEDLSPPTPRTASLTNAEKGLPTAHARPEGRERKAARRLSGKE